MLVFSLVEKAWYQSKGYVLPTVTATDECLSLDPQRVNVSGNALWGGLLYCRQAAVLTRYFVRAHLGHREGCCVTYTHNDGAGSYSTSPECVIPDTTNVLVMGVTTNVSRSGVRYRIAYRYDAASRHHAYTVQLEQRKWLHSGVHVWPHAQLSRASLTSFTS